MLITRLGRESRLGKVPAVGDLTRVLSGIELWPETDRTEVATGNWSLETKCRVETSLSQLKGWTVSSSWKDCLRCAFPVPEVPSHALSSLSRLSTASGRQRNPDGPKQARPSCSGSRRLPLALTRPCYPWSTCWTWNLEATSSPMLTVSSSVDLPSPAFRCCPQAL